MGASSAVISADLFDEKNRHVRFVAQAGVPVVDADLNDSQESFYTQLRRAITNSIGDGARGNAFKIEGIPAANNFKVRGGDLGDEGPETLYVKGHQAQLLLDEQFLTATETAPIST